MNLKISNSIRVYHFPPKVPKRAVKSGIPRNTTSCSSYNYQSDRIKELTSFHYTNPS